MIAGSNTYANADVIFFSYIFNKNYRNDLGAKGTIPGVAFCIAPFSITQGDVHTSRPFLHISIFYLYTITERLGLGNEQFNTMKAYLGIPGGYINNREILQKNHFVYCELVVYQNVTPVL